MVQAEHIPVVEKFKKALSRLFSVQKVVLFGSLASGLFSERSDFDAPNAKPIVSGVAMVLREPSLPTARLGCRAAAVAIVMSPPMVPLGTIGFNRLAGFLTC